MKNSAYFKAKITILTEKKLKNMKFFCQILENPFQASCRKIISVLQMYADTGFRAPEQFNQLNPMFAD